MLQLNPLATFEALSLQTLSHDLFMIVRIICQPHRYQWTILCAIVQQQYTKGKAGYGWIEIQLVQQL